MMEAGRTSETLVNFYHTTRRYNPENSHHLETVCFPETLASTYKITRRHNPEEHRHLHRRGNLKSHEDCLTNIESIPVPRQHGMKTWGLQTSALHVGERSFGLKLQLFYLRGKTYVPI
jgi:hypothetical protein